MNNLRMSGAMFLMLKKSNDRRQREALEAAFKKADINGDGFLSADEYCRILTDHGIDCTHEEILQIMQVADKDHDGKISREEFVGEAPKRKDSSEAKAELAFNVFDKNHDGYITKGEMLKVSKNLTKEQVDAVFKRNDGNHDGKLTLEEFQEFMQHHSKNNEKK
jgi:calcium-binding protein CML